MSKTLSIICLFCFLSGWSQIEPDPLDKYGPPSIIITSLKEALKDYKVANKIKLENQILDPKLLPKMGKLKETYALQLSNNSLIQLPIEFTEMSSLIYFASAGNSLTSLPPGFGKLDQLTEIHLHSTQLDSIPFEIVYCGRLKVLEVQNNKSEKLHLPKSIGSLSQLNELTFFNTKLDSLPAGFSNFKKLKNLTLVKCNLDTIPKAITNILTLENLILDNNNINKLSTDIIKLKNLKTLSLKANKLTSVPDQICFLKKLEILDLRENNLKPYDIEILMALLPNCRIYY